MNCCISELKVYPDSGESVQNQSSKERQRHFNQDFPVDILASLIGTCCIDGLVAIVTLPPVISGSFGACSVIASSTAGIQCCVATASTSLHLYQPENEFVRALQNLATSPCSLLIKCCIGIDSCYTVSDTNNLEF